MRFGPSSSIWYDQSFPSSLGISSHVLNMNSKDVFVDNVMMTMLAKTPKVPMAIMNTPERVKARDGIAGLTKYEVGSSMISLQS